MSYRRPIDLPLSSKRPHTDAGLIIITIDRFPDTPEQLAAAKQRGQFRGTMSALTLALLRIGNASQNVSESMTNFIKALDP